MKISIAFLSFVSIFCFLSCKEASFPIPTDLSLYDLKGKVKTETTMSHESSIVRNFNEYGYLTDFKWIGQQMKLEAVYAYEKPGFLYKVTSTTPISISSIIYEYDFDERGKLKGARIVTEDGLSYCDYQFHPNGIIKSKVITSMSETPQIMQGCDFDENGKKISSKKITLESQNLELNPIISEDYSYDDKGNLISILEMQKPDVTKSNETTYTIIKMDEKGNWLERRVKVRYLDGTGDSYTETRSIVYY